MQEYCYKCMRPLNGSPVCGNCGCDNSALKPSNAPYHLTRGTMLCKRYLVGSVLGEGGFGITYIGLDTTLSKRVAIKEFYPSGAANRTNTVSEEVIVTPGKESFFNKGVDRFLFEAKNVAAFSEEEGIVDVLDYFQENGTAYIVMEFLDGQNLKDYVNTNGKFKLEQLVTLMTPIMKSLSYMHSRGIIHRDISPDNIMYTKRGKLKLMDFGSARYYTNEDRKMSVILKQGFAPEEQYRSNGEQGPHTDVYALCATIYACVTGSAPVTSLDRLVNDTLKPPSQCGVQALPHQEKALMHGLAVLKKDRTPDMDTLLREFTVSAAETKEPFAQPKAAAIPKKPVQPVYDPPYSANAPQQAQPVYPNAYPSAYPNSYPPASKANKPKKTKAFIIILIVIVVLALIGGGIAIAAVLRGGDSNGGSTPQTSTSASGKETTDVHTLLTQKDEVAITDNALDTGDAAAEQKLNKYIDDKELNSEFTGDDEMSAMCYACGNAMIFEYDLNYLPTKAEADSIKTTLADIAKNNTDDLNKIRTETAVDNAVVIYVYLDSNKDLVVAEIVK